MFRMRGRSPEDLNLIPGKFRKAYSRQSVPNSDRVRFQSSADELLDGLNRVHELAIARSRSDRTIGTAGTGGHALCCLSD